MNDKKIEKEEYYVDVQRLLSAVMHKSWLIAIVSIVCAVAMFCGTFFFVTPLYESSTMFYVNNKSISVGDISASIGSTDISASKSLVSSYIVILKTRTALNDVIEYSGVDRTYSEILDMIEASDVDSTEIFKVVVTSPDPIEAEKIASAIAYILPKRIGSIIEGSSARIVDTAVIPSAPSSPSYTRNTLLGFILGLVVTVAAIVLHEVFDTTIRTEEDVAQISSYPILASVPDMQAPSKGSYYSSDKKKTAASAKTATYVGRGISFSASEAYKLLRTKLEFSFVDQNDCRVIGVTSSMAGEGKSTSAANLAYALAQLDNRVLLIECDLRRPTIGTKLPVAKVPGLTNFLTRQNSIEEVVQMCNLDGNTPFHVITSGRVPPNPIELLSSDRMAKLMIALRKNYNYVILDLPPVGEVSDALVASKLVDGMLLVVRQNYCNRVLLDNAIRQFDFIGTRVLGVVVSYASESAGGYRYNKSYYKQYYHSASPNASAPHSREAKE